MITKLTSLKELPYKTYTATLLKSEKDIKPEDEGYLIITENPVMIILFKEFVEEIHGKVIREVEKAV